jgi:plasmid stability protein
MASVTVRNLSDEVHRALRVRAATHGRSTEAEILCDSRRSCTLRE